MADVTSIPGVGGVSGDSSRQGGFGSSRQRPKPAMPVERPGGPPAAPDDAVEIPVPAPDDPTIMLVAALDRLRVTDESRSAETEVMRAMRGALHYQEESRHSLPVIPDPERAGPTAPPDPPPTALPPDQTG